MASKRRLRRKRCTNKQPYPNAESASFAAGRLRRKYMGEAYTTYHCGSHWHVGHTPKRIRQAMARRRAA